MENDQAEKRRKGYVLMRSVMDFGMGLIILGFGVFFLASPYIGVGFTVEPFFRYFFGVMCLIYGGWRMYRGYKKEYYTE